MVLDYRNQVYGKYVSAFKAQTGEMPAYVFSNEKLIPILEPWVRHLSRETQCLDLGCGHGNVLHALRTLGFRRLQGVDLSAEQITIAQSEFPQTEQMTIVEKLERSAPESYGLVTIFDVLEHLTKSELLDLFRLIASRIAPGGVIIAHTPNGDSPFIGSVRYGDFTHETVLTPQSARNICSLSGFCEFEAKEHLGASASPLGRLRWLSWRVLRTTMRVCHSIETGKSGPTVLTRNFAFRASRCM